MKKTVLISAPKYYGIDSDIQESFTSLGFKTVLINHVPLTIIERFSKYIGSRLPFLKPIVNNILKSSLDNENEEFASIVSKVRPDLLLIIQGDHIFPTTIENIKKVSACPIVSYIWDDPFNSYNNHDEYRKSNFINGILLYDSIFVFDTFYVDEIKKRGAKKVKYLPLATNPKRYKDILVTEQDRRDYSYDICFIGLPFANRIEMFEYLRSYNFGVFGDHWREYFIRKGQKTPSYYRGKATGETVNKIYLSSKIVLNIHHPQSIEGLNTRTFDIPACGAFEMVDYKKYIEKHFAIDKEIVTFRNISELKRNIDFYLKNDGLRKSISALGKKKVLSEHTWVHRANDIITALK